MLAEDFEDTTYVFTIVSAGGWARSSSQSHGGDYAFRSGTIGDGQTSTAVITVPSGAVAVQFWYKVSSEQNYDYFRFYVGGAEQLAASGEVGWTQSAEYPLGEQTQISFAYSKDSSSASGADAAFVDDVTFVLPSVHLLRRPPSPAASHRGSRW
ncbi:hypothetical protein GCM10017673_38250 [Streptosporangium violaceochromogenes]|nr:hypothetical protein GCM10017673_38250 [Streptosporangium violaceochromogenes]